MSRRFEVVDTDAGHHGRFVAANGATVWSTEVYTRRRGVLRAIELVTGGQILTYHGGPTSVLLLPAGGTMSVRHVDERTRRGHLA